MAGSFSRRRRLGLWLELLTQAPTWAVAGSFSRRRRWDDENLFKKAPMVWCTAVRMNLVVEVIVGMEVTVGVEVRDREGKRK